jgi:Ca2+/Na+ antiporter
MALGNGAADMFSVIAAVRVGATDLAVGALQGGSMCVTCVVTAGVLMVVRGGNVKASGVFFTDVCVNIVSCIAIFVILHKGYTTFWEGLGLLGLYTVYVFGVSLVGHGWIPPMLEKDRAAWRLKKEAEADLQEHLAAVSCLLHTYFSAALG